MSSINKDPDPGGSQGASNREITDLKDQNEQQQVLIAQLKEMLRKTDQQTNVTEDKMQEYIKTLNRKKNNKLKTGDVISVNIDSNKKERLNLLRQQMEENKAKLAERGKSQKGLEEMVSQLTVQLNDSQNLISQSSLNLSIQEGKLVDYSRNTSQDELYNILLTKEKKITELGVKVQKLEGNVLDLEENLKEKDSVIDARTKAITLMTESLNKKGKSTLDELDETKEQMKKMQENFVSLEQDMKSRQLKLLEDLKMKNNEILDLQELNEKLENEKEELKNHLKEKLKIIEDLKIEETPKKEASPKSSPSRNRKNRKGKNQKKETTPPAEDIDVSKITSELEEMKKQNEDLLKKNVDITKIISELEELKKLNEDLQKKNLDIAEENNTLKERCQNIMEENEGFVKKIKILEQETTESLEELNQLKDKMREKIITDSSSSTTEESEVAKFKKQIEENNKNMIKIKAQNNSKIKELNKKLNTFKKMNDANALILQLQNENSKLEQKIAELEDEKGNLQLKMVESTESVKDEPLKEIISKLEVDKKDLEEKIETLQEKISSFTQVQTQQVQSEISSIQFEEKLDLIEKEKEAVITEKEDLECKCTELTEKLESLTKEKTELSAKLENYIQENMELIDKLEKLSAEKVSSAESIEIVEGLTLQEKLDFAAYEKNMEVSEDLRMESSDTPLDQSSEPPEELNQTVLQLNEETTELLQKIEMFNVERKEVMLKLDALKEENEKLMEDLKEFEKIKEENSQMSVQLKQVENNRDVLEETYEQLQTEKEVLEKEKDDLIKQLKNATISDRLKDLQHKCEDLIKENESLKKSLKKANEDVSEKDTDLLKKLSEAKTESLTLEAKLKDCLEEIENSKVVIEENKEELINSSKIINQMQVKIDEKEEIIKEDKQQLEEMTNNIEDLNDTINELKKLHEDKDEEIDVKYNENINNLEEQLKELKESLSSQIEQADEYEKELNECHEIITKLNAELKELNLRVANYQEMLQNKDKELEKYTEDISEQESFIKGLENSIHEKNNELSNKEKMVVNLTQTISEKDEKFNNLTTELTEKFLNLQQQMNSNNGVLEGKIIELQTKNKELLEKLKKYAANLKKKTQDYKDLEAKLALNDNQEFKKQMSELQTNLEKLTQEKQELESNNVQLQNTILSLKEERTNEKENTLSLKQEFSNIHEKSDDFDNADLAKDSKIKELEMIIETQENDMAEYREKISRLEEGISVLEERRLSLERTNVALGDKLTESSISFEEKSLEEEQLEQKMGALIQKDDELTKKLDNLSMDNEELTLRNTELCQEQCKLVTKINDLETQLCNAQQDLEFTKVELQKPISNLENQIRILQNEKDMFAKKYKEESEKYENEIQIQMEELMNIKNELTIQNEKLLETVQDLSEKNNELHSQIEDLKEKLEDTTKSDQLQDQIKQLKNTEALLKQEIEDLKIDLLKKTAIETVDEVITEAKSQVDSKEPEVKAVPTFNWDSFNPQQQTEANDWFAVQETAQKQHAEASQAEIKAPVDNTSEELQKKIKTLEFMLYNVEKEKDNALLQCHGLTNELTRLVYEREQNIPPLGGNLDGLEAQVVSIEDTTDNKDLRGLEFEATRSVKVGNAEVPIVEDLVMKKEAYKCFIDEERLESIPGLEAQIVPMGEDIDDITALRSSEFEPTLSYHEANPNAPIVEDLAMKKEAYQCFKAGEDDARPEDGLKDSLVSMSDSMDDRRALQNLEFQPTSNYHEANPESPNFENLAMKKEAYQCFNPTEDNVAPKNTFGDPQGSSSLEGLIVDDNDDGWGWGPEEAKKEEAYMLKTSAVTEISELKSQVDSLNEQVRVFQLERESHLEEIKQLQVKSGKLIKKCKEFKLKYEQISKKESSAAVSKDDDFFNLDNAIQEELKVQVERLEKTVKDVTSELEKEKLEKLMLVKKVDTLTTANEKFVEIKERQDFELMNLQRKYDELQNADWGNPNVTPEKKTVKFENTNEENSRKYEECRLQVEELKETIKDIMLDNEELQSLLEEQKNLRNKAESKLKNLTVAQDNVRSEEEFIDVCNEKQKLEKELENIKVQNRQLEISLKSNKNLEDEYSVLLNTKNDFENQLQQLKDNSKTIQEYEVLLNERNNLKERFDDLNQRYEDEVLDRSNLEARYQHVGTNYENITREITELRNDKEELLSEVSNKDALLENIMQEKLELENQVRVLEDRVEEIVILQDKINILKEKNQDLANQLSKSDAVVQQSSVFEVNNPASFFDEIAIPTEEKHPDNEETLKPRSEVSDLENKLLDTSEQNQNLNSQIQELKCANTALLENEQQLLATYQKNLEITVEDLNKKWEEECINRGDVIAETWKLHLETVETEFAHVRNKLQVEVNDLEEKCNGLVNENNELRKNVDAEIRNEVDKISALQLQITNGQKSIAELSTLLQQKDIDYQHLQNTVMMLQSEVDQYKVLLQEKEAKLDGINVVIETTMKQFDEKREVVEEVVKILEKNAGYVLSFDKLDIVSELEQQLGSKNAKLQEHSAVVKNLEETISDLTQKLNTLKEIKKDNKNLELELNQAKSDLLMLQNSLQETQRSLFETAQNYSEKSKAFDDLLLEMQNLEEYKVKLEKLEKEHSTLAKNLEESNQQISDLTQKLLALEDMKNDSNIGVHNLELELNSLEKTQKSQNYSEKSKAFDDLLLEMQNLQKLYQSKENECLNLQSLYEDKCQESSQYVEETYKTQIRQLENHYENILMEKQNDFDALKSMNEDYQMRIETLKSSDQKLQEHQQFELKCAELEHHIGELNAYIQGQNERIEQQNLTIEESNKQVEDMQVIIEQQVAKIEELRKEVFSKSNEFDSFVAQMENIIPGGTITKQPLALPDKTPEGEESVSAAEHDLALYMLHQRDVRCEELTEELTHLLEERDLLQLRLSIAIREKEEMRKKTVEDAATTHGASTTGLQASPSKSGAIFMAASGIEMGKEPLEEEGQNLATKLSELKSVGYKKDKTFVDEKELRKIQQLAIMQEHMNEASKLPAEAAQKLVDASYTLSRDVQSPSKVLLNWLWGRSTPKVNDT
ncbi:unnamed protein product [Brassicogethes aeneus]|uniref:Uncharacterized protein n=1 Tax=Brassicogethes aeneus TaxID=1431903 RepID=A0A9P0BCU2_BRAAE|nr:unnamed protein product [Brassicogethes aeneus]